MTHSHRWPVIVLILVGIACMVAGECGPKHVEHCRWLYGIDGWVCE